MTPTPSTPPVVFLLALWGESYIHNFFEYSLKTLLAPGNVPALSADFPCTFLFLTSAKDVHHFTTHPLYPLLCSYCTVSFIGIEDLIFQGNYSATLTMAFERGMRSRGETMCSTYFFFLVSDYLLADGSFHHLKRYLHEGYSGITTGNFLVIEESFSPKIHTLMQKHPEGLLVLNPREMLSMAFPHLHPVSTAQTVTQSFTHATHANRLFWKVSDQILIGRFFLRHMLCIRPEIENFIIGSSCDYSFIHEMCPSGKIKHIQDSDEYCVIEMAPYRYEQEWIQTGPFTIPQLAHLLSEWTTSQHRANAHFPIIYHSTDLNESHQPLLEESQKWIDQLEEKMDYPPKPIRGHCYWNSCVESILHWVLQQKERSSYLVHGVLAGLFGSPTFSPPLGEAVDHRYLITLTHPPASLPLTKKQKRKQRWKILLTGHFLKNRMWHINWIDDYHFSSDLQSKLSQRPSCLILAFYPCKPLFDWIEHHYPNTCTYQFYDLFKIQNPEQLSRVFKNKDQVVLWTTEQGMLVLAEAIKLCAHYLPSKSPITLYFKPSKFFSKKQFKKLLAICSADLLHAHIHFRNLKLISNYSLKFLGTPYSYFIHQFAGPRKRVWSRLFGCVGLLFLNILSLLIHPFSLLKNASKKANTAAIVDFES